MVYKRLRGGLPLNKNLLSTPSPLPGCYVSMTLGPAHKCCFKQDFEFSRRVTVIFRFELYTVAYKLKLPAKYGESCFTRFNFFWDQKWVFKQKRDVLLFLLSWNSVHSLSRDNPRIPTNTLSGSQQPPLLWGQWLRTKFCSKLTRPLRPCLIQTEITFQLHRTWRGFFLTV